MSFIDTTDLIGGLLMSLTNDVTGSLFLTLLMIVFFIVIIGLAFRLPLEITFIIALPLYYVSVVYSQEMYPVLAVALIHIAILFTRYIMRF